MEVYNVNVPMRVDVLDRPVRYTRALENFWSRGCLYVEVEGEDDSPVMRVNGHADAGKKLVNGSSCNGVNGTVNGTAVNGVNGASQSHLKQRHFAWSADLSDMKRGLLAAPEGTDAHTVLNGCTR